MKRVPKAPPKENQTNQQRNAIEAERKFRVHFTNYVEELTSLKRSKQSKKQSGNPNTISREELQSTAQRYDKKFQDLLEEVNTKTGIGYKIIEDSDRPNKLKVLYQQTVHLLEEEIPKQLQRRNKLVPYQANFVEEHLKEARKCKASLDYHWLAYISKGTQPAMNAEQSNTAQAVNDSESNNNYQTDNPVAQTVQNGATASGQETENVSETSSAKQRREERMKKFDIEFETKMRLEQARFERRKLELEMQMKELETKHQLLEEERELERKVKRTALENDDARSQSTGARDKSPFNWTPKKRDVSDWASRIDNLLTPDRSTARFEVTPEVNRQSHFSRYRSSRDRSSSVEDRDVSPRAGLLRYNTGYSGSSSLPKLKLNNFDGNPLEWPEWSSMFIATVDQRPIPDSEKMSHLKTLLTGKARSAISGMGYSGQFYGAAWNILERKFGRPHVIIDAQLESLRKASQVKPHDSTGLISFSVIVSNFVNVLKEYKQIGHLQSSSTLYMAVDKLPQVLKEKWWFYVDDKDEDWPDLILFEKWLSRIAFVHEGFSAFKGERREEDRRSTNRDKRFSKTSNFSASSNVKETKQMQSDHCPLADGTHKIWNCPLFRNMSVNDRYAAVRKQRLCYGCLGKGHAIKDCKVNACGINGCIKKHNRLLHSENQMDEGNHAVNVSAATINQSNEVTSFLQIVPVSIQSGGNRLNTYAFLDSGSTVSFIDQSVQEKLRAQGTGVTLNIAGIHGTKDLKTEKVPLKIKGLHSKVHSIEAFAHPSISLGNTNYNYNKLKQSFNHLSVLPNKSFNLMEVGIILGQDAYELQRPLDYKIGTRSEPFAVLTELGWVVSGPMTGKRRQNVCHFAFTEDVKVAENIQTWWDIETYASKINVVSQSKKELQAQKMLESTTKFTGERYEVGMLWSEPEPNLPNNYSSALGQLYSLERRFQRDPNLKNLYQQSIDTDVEKGFVKILDESEVKGTFGKEWYLPHHPVLNPNKPGKVRRVCNAASKHKEVCLNDKLLAGPDLLHGLIGTIFRFREGPIALTADIESMFLQVQVPEQDRSCLRFLWRPRTNEPVQIYEYQRHVFGAKSSPICASYALKRVGLDNEKEYPIATKAIQNNFYMDDFIKSVETPEEAIEVFNQLQPLLSQHGFELKKWISNNDEVTEAIPEDLKSISNTKQVEVEPSTEGS